MVREVLAKTVESSPRKRGCFLPERYIALDMRVFPA